MKILHVLHFLLFYFGEVIKSNIRVAWDVMTPRMRGEPAFLKIPVDDLGPKQQLVLANLITMTPGTLSIDLDNDGKYLHVHSLFAPDPEAAARELREDFVERVKRAF